MQLTKAHHFAGRKLRKKLDADAKSTARKLISGDLGVGTSELADARAIMETYHWMKSRHIDSLIMEKKRLGGWIILLTFTDLPRGVPNVLGAPGKARTEEEALFEAKRLLTAAYVKCDDTRAMMRSNTFTDARIFRLQDLHLQVPGEIVDSIARKLPDIPPEKEAQKMRMSHIENIRQVIGDARVTADLWDIMSEEDQLKIVVEAAHLLCLNINIVA